MKTIEMWWWWWWWRETTEMWWWWWRETTEMWWWWWETIEMWCDGSGRKNKCGDSVV